jgi:hypothetical protein
MWIDNGRIQTIGTPMDVIEDYLETTENQRDKIRGEWIENKNDLSVVDYSNLKNSLLNIHSISVLTRLISLKCIMIPFLKIDRMSNRQH